MIRFPHELPLPALEDNFETILVIGKIREEWVVVLVKALGKYLKVGMILYRHELERECRAWSKATYPDALVTFRTPESDQQLKDPP